MVNKTKNKTKRFNKSCLSLSENNTKLTLYFLFFQVQSSGLFELRLKHFTNENGKDNVGECCSGKSDDSGKCIGTCKTRFRVCLKHYQAQIDVLSSCTFGKVETPVLGENSVNLTTQSTQALGFTNPIRFPFDFTWPVSNTIIILDFYYKIFLVAIYFPSISQPFLKYIYTYIVNGHF